MERLVNNPFGLEIIESPGSTPEVPLAIRPEPTMVDRSNGFTDRYFLIDGNYFQETNLEGYQGWLGEKALLRWHLKDTKSFTAVELNRIALNRVTQEYPILGILSRYLDFLVIN